MVWQCGMLGDVATVDSLRDSGEVLQSRARGGGGCAQSMRDSEASACGSLTVSRHRVL
jgi:hypothetical protein